MMTVMAKQQQQRQWNSLVMILSIIIFVLSIIGTSVIAIGDDTMFMTTTVVDDDQTGQHFCLYSNGHMKQCKPGQFNDVGDIGDGPYVRAYYKNSINKTGWATLEIQTNPSLPDHVQAYHAGVMEALITAPLINASRLSKGFGTHYDRNNVYCKKLRKFLLENLNATIERIKNWNNGDGDDSDDPDERRYWHEIGLTLYQIAGIDDGYLAAIGDTDGDGNPKMNQKDPHLNIDPCGSMLLNVQTEIDDIYSIMAANGSSSTNHPLHRAYHSRCSALIKYLPEKHDALVSHTTWASYSSMLRVMKRYLFNYHSSLVKNVVMSSNPGSVFSGDDYYLTSAGLVIQETTINNYNQSAWNGYTAKNFVLEFLRNTVANRLARSGEQWTRIFSQHNSGTYNNQFMVVDYKKLPPLDGSSSSSSGGGSELQDGFLWILEQMPHYIERADLTAHIRRYGYWSSYNIPYFDTINRISGYEQKCVEYRKLYNDSYYCYHDAPRARIFDRDHGLVHNITTLYRLMRYNNFRSDPLSYCGECEPKYNAKYTIASRADLNDPNGHYPIPYTGFSATGAIDAKMTNRQLMSRTEMVAVSGPTTEGGSLPPFDWRLLPRTKDTKNIRHDGQPLRWQFGPIITKWQY